MAASANDEPSKGTPVPPRGARRASSRPGGQIGRPGAANRRAAMAEARKKRQTALALTGIAVVVVVVAVFVAVSFLGGGTKRSSTASSATNIHAGAATSASAPAPLYTDLAKPSVAALAAAAHNYHGSGLTYPTTINGTPLTVDGKPEVLYLGAEYCPYCAAERWAVAVALSKFGTFHGLTEIYSTASDYAHTPTISFLHATYSSPYLAFVSKEMEGLNGQPLQSATPAQQQLLQKYTNGSIPLVDLGGRAAIEGAEYSPSILAHMTPRGVADSIANGTSVVAAAVDADAGAIISQLCQLTHGQPTNVCSAFPQPITH